MSFSSTSDQEDEITGENLGTLLQQNATLVEFFNSFLALPCFAERIFYNSDIDLFEEFIEKIANDVGKGDAKAASQLPQFTDFKGTMYNVANSQSRVGYYVTVLDKVQGLEFVKKYRFPLFLRSELYAEYKLSKHLASVQDSFSRGLFSDGSDCEDSGVEEVAVGRNVNTGRRRSVVSFNLTQSVDDTASTDTEDSDYVDRVHLSPHFRSIEERFDAWHESCKHSANEMSGFSSAGGGKPLHTVPQIRDEGQFFETRSSSSCFSVRESDATVSNDGRPESGISFVSDSFDSRLSSASNVSVTLGTGSNLDQSTLQVQGSNWETVSGDTNRSQPRGLTFTFEHREVEESPSSPTYLANQPSKNWLTEQEEGEAQDTEIEDGMKALEKESTSTDTCVSRDCSLTGNERGENCITSKDNATPEDIDSTRVVEGNEQLFQVAEKSSNTDDAVSMCGVPQKEQGKNEDTVRDDGTNTNEIQSTDQADKGLRPTDNQSVVDCLHGGILKPGQKGTVRENSTEFALESVTNMTEGIVAREKSSDVESVTSTHFSMEDGRLGLFKKDEESNPLKSINHEGTCEAEREVPDQRSSANSGMGAEQQDRNNAMGEKEDAPREQGSQDEMEEMEEEDEEGGYTTEASATTLHGIRCILGSKRRGSTVATSVAFDLEDESAFSDDGSEIENKPCDLSTKDGFDAFKEFLLRTSGEKLFKFWVEIECGRHLKFDHERIRLIHSLRDRFWRTGGIYEFSVGMKTKFNIEDASKLTYGRLYDIQPEVLEPLLSYWCIRFIMHQQRHSHFQDLEYTRLVTERCKSCVTRENMLSNLSQVPAWEGLTQVLPERRLTRPHSSSVGKKTAVYQTTRPQIRAKSAHPRLIPAPKLMHTNASRKQLQYIMAPARIGYGFEQPPGPSFPVEPEADYHSSVRLFIHPIPSPDSRMQRLLRALHRTAVTPATCSKSDCFAETKPRSDAMLDSLIQGLIYEQQTGNYFEVFLQKSGNEVWMNCLAFWKSLQEFNAYFYADYLNPSHLSRKAQTMFANFIVSGGSQDVQVSMDIQAQVYKELEPPYEELFDAAEEHVLYSLLEPWTLLLQQEKHKFGTEVSKEQVLRHMDIKVMSRRRQSGVAHANSGLESADEEQEKERISVEEANRPLPVPKDGFTFETLIKTRDEVERFKEFLNKKHTKGSKDLMAWTDMETFRRVPRFMEEKRDKKAKEIRNNWLGKKYFFGQDSPATRDGKNLIINLNGGRPIKERPSSPVILESQKFVRARIERRWLMLFKQTTEFLERQKPRPTGVPEMVEDIMLKRRLQRSEAAWKILNSRWVSSSRDVVALRQTLLNPYSCAEFSAFVAMKGDTLESNVQFWLEVQKFKDLCHPHAQPSLIHRKIQTIIDCFLNSAIAPELQIDIPIEMADKLMERLTCRAPSVHPYVFREAQMTVFRVLFNHWKEFVTYRSKIPEGESAREHFRELLRRHRADIRSKKEASERRRLARLSAERKKKEKEEREKKRIEDLASLFSTETASIFYSEEDDLRSWFYSKHLVQLEGQEHMKRLREQGIILPEEDLVDEKEDAKSRLSRVSVAKSSTLSKVGDNKKDGASDKKSSEGSSRRLQAKFQSKLCVPGQLSAPSVVQSTTPRNSVVSLSFKDISKDEKKDISPKAPASDKKSERKTSEIQVMPLPQPQIQPPESPQNKLLPQRTHSSRRLFSIRNRTNSADKKPVPLDAISCISDYSTISNTELAPRGLFSRRLGRQAKESTLLTSKSLKDFTNSPEGAQLSVPLPLVRITSASHMDRSDTDGSLGDLSPLCFKPRPLTQSLRKSPVVPGRKKGLGLAREEMQSTPDVIVN